MYCFRSPCPLIMPDLRPVKPKGLHRQCAVLYTKCKINFSTCCRASAPHLYASPPLTSDMLPVGKTGLR